MESITSTSSEDQRPWIARRMDEASLPPHARSLGDSLWLLAPVPTIPTDWLQRLMAIEGWSLVVLHVQLAGPSSPRLIPSWAKGLAGRLGVRLWSEVIPGEDVRVFLGVKGTSEQLGELVKTVNSTTAYRNTLIVLVPSGAVPNKDSELARLFLRQVTEDDAGPQRIRQLREWAAGHDALPIVELRDPSRNAGLAVVDGTTGPPDEFVRAFSTELDHDDPDLHPQRFGAPLLDR
jgi:hypothetical protein